MRQALTWLIHNELPEGGIRVHEQHPRAYPEVTGYLVPTLIAYGEYALARRCLLWLLSIQEPDGSFWDPDRRKPFIFDTAQVVRGLLAGRNLADTGRAARRACDWLCEQAIDQGTKGFPEEYRAKEHIPESIQLYTLPVLWQATHAFGDPRYAETADRCLGFYLGQPYLLDVSRSLTHFLAYEIEALIDLGQTRVVEPVLDRLASLQLPDGSLRAMGEVGWVCTPGLLQLAVCWYKTGRREAAEAALQWAERQQRPSGGFWGSQGLGAWYFPTHEPAWATKYFLDAYAVRET